MTMIMRPEEPKGTENIPMRWASDAIAALLRNLDIPFLTLNPGASFRGLLDSLVNYLGNRDPQILLSLHEASAVAIAHGYAKVTGKPMGVVLHSNVGLMNATMTIFNAWCDRTPMIIIGATGPVDATKRRPWIDWIHTAQDQGALVRDYTKWDDQPASVTAALESLLRAKQLSCTEPPGPVYVCLDAALQERELKGKVSIPDPSRFKPAPPQDPSPEIVRRAAELLSSAKNPLILPGRVSRKQAHWDMRVKLAETLGAGVLTDIKVGAAFPSKHPLHKAGPCPVHLTEKAVKIIRESDVILSLDWVDLGGTLKKAWPDEKVSAKVIHASVDCYIHRGWSKDYQALPPVDLPILSQPDIVVSRLLDIIEAPGMGGRKMEKINDEAEDFQVSHQSDGPSISVHDMASALKRAQGERQLSLLRLPRRWPEEACDFQGPLDYLGKGEGGAVGSGPGLAVGAALALRGSGRIPVAILGDGDYLMGVTALWTAVRYGIPLLIIVANNRSFGNTMAHQERVAKERNRPVENKWIGNIINEPPVDLSAMARAQGFEAEGPIEDSADLAPALTRAFEAIEKGGCYLIDVVMG
jgi:thiamine pyrophosphate-dependent acetolactate synthase large subunit-like protein